MLCSETMSYTAIPLLHCKPCSDAQLVSNHLREIPDLLECRLADAQIAAVWKNSLAGLLLHEYRVCQIKRFSTYVDSSVTMQGK